MPLRAMSICRGFPDALLMLNGWGGTPMVEISRPSGRASLWISCRSRSGQLDGTPLRYCPLFQLQTLAANVT
jgi:hypothetical protein